MPRIERTERQVRIDGKPLPYDTGNGGQAIGAGISALGAAVSKFGAQQDEQEMFDARMKVSEYTFQQAKEADDKIANYNPAKDGPPGEFDQRYVEERAAKDQAFAEQFKSPKARQYAMLHTQTARQSAAMRAQNARQGFVQQENIGRITAMVGNAGEAIDGEPETVIKGVTAVSEAIDAVPGLTPAQRNALRGKASKDLWQTWLGKANEDQLRRGKADYERGASEWAKQFQSEEKPRAPGAGKIENHGEHSTVSGKSGARFRVASPYADRFAGLIADLEAEGVEIKPDQSGGYAKRNIAGTNTPSRHSHGEAIDINWSENARGARGEMAKRLGPAKINEIAKRHGMTWGGNWRNPDDMHFEIDRSAQPAPPVAKRGIVDAAGMREAKAPSVGAGPLSPEEAGDWGVRQPGKKFALPDRATIRDHAINEFTDLLPKIDKRIAELAASREGEAWIQDKLSGRSPFNKYDAEEKKTIDARFRDVKAGERIMEGRPEALAMVGPAVDTLGFLPAPLFGGLHSLIDNPDTGKQALGYTVLGNVLDKNPNALMGQGADEVAKRVEHFRIMSKYYGTEKALKLIAEEGTPEFKERKKALKVDVDKIMKKYEGDNAVSTIEGEMADGKISWLFSRPDVEYDPQQRAVAVNDFRTIYRRELEATGSEERAKAAAISTLKQTYGESNMFGRKRAVMYPIERIYPPVEGSHKYIEDEIKKEVGTYSPSAKMDTLAVVADHRTVKELHAWRAGRGEPPSYVVRYLRADGRMEERRFRPDPALATGSKAAFEAERAKAGPSVAPPATVKPAASPVAKALDKATEVLPSKSPDPANALREAIKGGEVLEVDGSPLKTPTVTPTETTGGFQGAAKVGRSLSRRGGPSVGGN